MGAEFVAKSAPDGHTLLRAHTGTMLINPAVPARTVQELVALAKAQPGRLKAPI